MQELRITRIQDFGNCLKRRFFALTQTCHPAHTANAPCGLLRGCKTRILPQLWPVWRRLLCPEKGAAGGSWENVWYRNTALRGRARSRTPCAVRRRCARASGRRSSRPRRLPGPGTAGNPGRRRPAGSAILPVVDRRASIEGSRAVRSRRRPGRGGRRAIRGCRTAAFRHLPQGSSSNSLGCASNPCRGLNRAFFSHRSSNLLLPVNRNAPMRISSSSCSG